MSKQSLRSPSKDSLKKLSRKPSPLSINSDSSRLPREEEDDDVISSLYTLKRELSEYLDQTESSNIYHEFYPGVEMINYDFTAERQNLYSTNIIESTAHLIKGCLGAGVFGIHEGYMYGGLWASLVGTVLIGILVFYSMTMLVKSAHIMYGRLRIPRLSYPDLAEAAIATGPLHVAKRYSKVFRYTLELFLFIEFNGTCCIFEIMIANTLKKVLEAVSPGVESMEFSIRLYILMVTVPLLALCLIRSLKYLAPFSLIADIIIGLCVVTTMFYSVSIASNLSDRPAFKSLHGLFRFCGVCVYSIDGVGVILPIENHMRRPMYYSTVIQFAMSIVIPLIAIIGFFGYWAFGEECETPITIHMSIHTGALAMQFFLTVSLSVTFAVHFWVPFRITWHYVGKKYKRRRVLWERIFRILHVLLITSLAIALPNMTKWMTFLGSFFMAFIVFIFPAFIEILVMWKEPIKGYIRWGFVKNICLITLGLILCAGSFYSYK